MGDKVAASEFVESYRLCAALLSAVGQRMDRAALVDLLAPDEEQGPEIEKALSSAGGRRQRRVSPEVADRMRQLQESFFEQFSYAAARLAGMERVPSAPDELARQLSKVPRRDKDAVADFILLNGHRELVKARHINVTQLRPVVEERQREAPLALVKLVPYLREELQKRGSEMSEDEIRALFTPGSDDRQVPYCLKWILQDLDGEFNAGLIGIEQMVGDKDPDEWLEAVRRTLQFRSHAAMHKAIAEATDVKYDSVHKALSGRKKARRIQAEVKYCLDKWLKDLEEGREPDIKEDYRGVPIGRMSTLLPELEQKFGSKEEMYRVIADKAGVKPGSVRRYFHANGQLKYAPLTVYRWAVTLAAGGPVRPARSYLANKQTRRVARDLSRRTNEVLRQWQREGDNPELAIAYKELRRALIVAVKEQRRSSPTTA